MNQKAIYLLGFLIATLISCDTKNRIDTEYGIHPKNNEKDLLVERQKFIVEDSKRFDGIYKNYIYSKYSDDAINSIKIVDKIDVPKTKLSVIFYSFNLGTEIIRETVYMIKENDKYFIHNEYFSSYDDDPYRNGQGEEGKELLKKIEKWESENENINWYK